MKTRIAIENLALIALLVVCTLSGSCQTSHSVDTGSVENGSYHSLYFHLLYEYPSSTLAVDVHTLALPQRDPNGNNSLLFAAKESQNQDHATYPSGVVLYAENIAHYQGQVQSGLDYLRMIMRTWPQNNYLKQQTIQTSAGITFYRVDYHPMDYEYDAAVVGVTHGYALVFKFNADSQSHLDNLVSSLSSIKNDR